MSAPLRYRAAFAALALAAGALALAACAARDGRAPDPGGSAEPAHERALVERGLELYAQHCVLCHGGRGAGDGPAAELLFPPARDFTHGSFRLVSTPNGSPTDADLMGVLERGMPGSAMPSWKALPERDRLSLARAVRSLAIDGLAERLASGGMQADEALEAARARLEPAERYALPEAPPASDAVLARGRALYAQHCAACHGDDGRGEPEPRWNSDGSLNWARDFTAGVLKGGASFADIAWRVRCGLPGSAMPGLELAPDDLGALVRWVQVLAPEETGWRLVQQPKTLTAVRVLATPEVVDGIEWNASREQRFVLAPLAWDAQSVIEVRVSAVHDGEQLAIRLRWDDAQADGPGGELLSDAVAVGFAPRDTAPLVGMGGFGAGDGTIALWTWRAAPRPSERGADAPPHAGLGASTTARVIEARSFGTLETGPGHALQAQSRRTENGWEVVMVHPLGPLTAAADPALTLAPRRSIPFALACWNGAAGDRAGRKSFTIWHSLTLD